MQRFYGAVRDHSNRIRREAFDEAQDLTVQVAADRHERALTIHLVLEATGGLIDGQAPSLNAVSFELSQRYALEN